MRFFALLLLVAFAACSPVAPSTCSASNCLGCCDASGACQLGNEKTACGAGGNACDTCVQAQTCVVGRCSTLPTGGGAGGGGGSMCAGALTQCGLDCVDLLSSADDCGACGQACAAGKVCNRGACEALPDDCVVAGWCPAGTTCDPMTKRCTEGCRVQADCPMGAACTNGTCACPSGQHACGRACVSNTSVNSCGSSCTVCPATPNGTSTCDGTSCGRTCDAGARLCGDTCAVCTTPANAVPVCNGSACDFNCNPGFHRCGTVCLSNTSVDSCGASCAACTAPANATRSCTNGACGFTCDAGRRLCGGTCAACTTPANATPACSGTSCDFACNAGYHRCGNQCLPDDSTASCGTRCDACPSDPNGTALCSNGTCYLTCGNGTLKCGAACATCPTLPANATLGCTVGNACDFTCDTGYHRCGNQCVANDSITGCGPSCTVCSTSFPDATATCQNNQCTYACGQGWLRCAAGCCRAATVTSGFAQVCATTPAGDALCWGQNFDNYALTPVLLSTGSVTMTATMGPLCLLLSGGEVRCRDSQTRQFVTILDLGPGVQKVVSGAAHGCALTAAGGVKCWGDNTYGQLGTNATTPPSPIHAADVSGLTSGVTSLDVGAFHSCAVLGASGEVRCWGINTRGVLGDGTNTFRAAPVTVASLGGTATAVAAGGGHSCALMTGGTVKCWGRNLNGELGNNATANESFTPVPVSGLTAVTQLDLGDRHSCARTMAGGLKCWGSNAGGRLGDGTSTQRLTPVDVFGLTSGVATFSAGDSSTCAINTTGELLCWGDNSNHVVGDGTTTSRSRPTYVLGR